MTTTKRRRPINIHNLNRSSATKADAIFACIRIFRELTADERAPLDEMPGFAEVSVLAALAEAAPAATKAGPRSAALNQPFQIVAQSRKVASKAEWFELAFLLKAANHDAVAADRDAREVERVAAQTPEERKAEAVARAERDVRAAQAAAGHTVMMEESLVLKLNAARAKGEKARAALAEAEAKLAEVQA